MLAARANFNNCAWARHDLPAMPRSGGEVRVHGLAQRGQGLVVVKRLAVSQPQPRIVAHEQVQHRAAERMARAFRRDLGIDEGGDGGVELRHGGARAS